MQEKPFSPACQRNQEPILELLKQVIKETEHTTLLELGSGTGQHAAFLAENFPFLKWICSDMKDKHDGIQAWINDCKNVEGPIEIEIGKTSKLPENIDLVFTANTLHIMSWDFCQKLIELCSQSLKTNALVIIYGPFNYNGNYSSESNAEFDKWLKNRDPQSAIRDFEAIRDKMQKENFKFVNDFEMPANNRVLVFQKL